MDKSEEPIHQRLSLLIEILEGGVQRRFAQTVGIATGIVGDMLGQRKSKPGFDLISKILRAYPQLRAEWLILGEGDMLKSSSLAPNPKKNVVSSGLRATGSTEFAREYPFVISAEAARTRTTTPHLAQPATSNKVLPGTDLIEQVAQNTADIKTLMKFMTSMKDKE